jgi:hypothetical protein
MLPQSRNGLPHHITVTLVGQSAENVIELAHKSVLRACIPVRSVYPCSAPLAHSANLIRTLARIPVVFFCFFPRLSSPWSHDGMRCDLVSPLP